MRTRCEPAGSVAFRWWSASSRRALNSSAFVIGSDWLQPGTDIREWHSKEGRTGEQLLNEFDFLVLPRPGYDVDDIKAFGPRMYWLTLPENFQMVESNASSSEVRKRAKTQWLADPKHGQNLQALNGLVPPGVHAFCLRNRLYEYLARPEAEAQRQCNDGEDSGY